MSKEKIINKVTAILLIICMTFVNIIFLGYSAVIAMDEELEAQTNTTTEGNISFDAYFKQDTNKIHQKELKISEEETLYIQVKVKNKVSISNAKIQIENANFKIDKEKAIENRYVQEINEETNEIELTAISSNNEVILELPIEFKSKETVSESYFNQENNLVLTGKYKDIDQNEKDLNGEVKIRTTWADEPEVELTQSIDKYFSLGELGLVLQQKVATQVKNNILPRSEEKLDINVPELENEMPENVTVLVNGEKLEEEKVTYTKEIGTIKINNKKEANENTEINWGEENCEYTIIYKYPNKIADVERDISLITKASTKLFTKEKSIEKENEQNTHIQKAGNVATTKTEITGEIYKGYMYAESEKEIKYDEKNEIEVSYLEGVNEMKFNTNEDNLISSNNQENDSKNDTRYISTSINKYEMLDVLGQTANININDENGSNISIINKDSQADENGNIVIKYNDEYTKINIQASKPEKEGKITINNVKALKGKTEYSKKQLEDFVKLKNTATIETNISKETASSEIELKEPVTEAKIEVNKETLSTMKTNKDVEIKAVLKSNSPKYETYSNPQLEIEIPQDITKVEVTNISVLYGEYFTVKPIIGTINGKQVIKINLEGQQKEYNEQSIEGTTIIINANLTLNNKSTSKEDNFVMTYSNANANKYLEDAEKGTDNAKINIVSPKGLITTNNIESLEIETIGEEKEISQKLEKSTVEKEIKVEQEIINNNESKIENVKILGTFGTDGITNINGKEIKNNIGETLKTALNVETENVSKLKIYYTQNENATDDLENSENKWQETITDPAKTRKYLVAVENMEATESLALNYTASIPEKLEYNQQNYQTYTATYTETSTGVEQNVEATIVELNTGKGPVAEAEVSASIGKEELKNNDVIKTGEIINYSINVKNTGEEDVTNTTVNMDVPEGTEFVTTNPSRNEPGNLELNLDWYIPTGETNKKVVIDNLKVGETKTINITARVKESAVYGSEIKGKAQLEYGEVKKESNEFICKLPNSQSSRIRAEVDGGQGNTYVAYAGGSTFFDLTLRNYDSSPVNQATVDWNFPEEYTLSSQSIITNEGNITVDKNEKITVSIPANGSAKIRIFVNAKEIEETSKSVSIAAKVTINNENYRSNECESKIINVNKYIITMSANNENEYVAEGNNIIYTIKMANQNEQSQESVTFNIDDYIPQELTIQEVSVDGVQKDLKDVVFSDNLVSISDGTAFKQGETKTIIIKTIVNHQESIGDNYRITNKASFGGYMNTTIESNVVTHILKGENPGGGDNAPEDGDDTKTTYEISGIAWLDSNNNGEKDNDEKMLSDINVYLMDLQTNTIAKNKKGNEIKGKTTNDGFYGLSGIQQGEYIVVFEYDTNQYSITAYRKEGVSQLKNSSAILKNITINGQEKKMGATDNIKITNQSVPNINIGLTQNKKFDLQIDKYISKITVQNSKGTKTYNYTNEKLAKVELDAKNINNSNIVIEYKIIVKNTGEIDGYIKNIADYLPSDLSFKSELNKDWYQDGSIIYNNTLKNEKITVGESKEFKLIATKTMNENNTGLITNTAEIAESYNDQGIADINSTPGNKKQGENDTSSADILISIKTGETFAIVGCIIIIITTLAVGIYFIKTKVLPSKN